MEFTVLASITLILVVVTSAEIAPITDNLCQDHLSILIMEISVEFLKDQHYLHAIEAHKSSDSVGDIFRCTNGNQMLPVLYYKLDRFIADMHLMRKNPASKRNINPYSTIESFLLSVHYTEALKTDIIANIAFKNPRAKVIFITFRLQIDAILDILRFAWTTYKMNNIMIINVLPPNILVCLLNPYIHKSREIQLDNLYCANINRTTNITKYGEVANTFINDREKDLLGYQVRVSIMRDLVVSKAIEDSAGNVIRYAYTDGEIIFLMSQMMNFSVKYLFTEDPLSYGHIYQNGSFAGSFAYIENEQVDLAANSLMIFNYGTSNLQYLYPKMSVKLYFVAPKDYYLQANQHVFLNNFNFYFTMVNISFVFLFPLMYVVMDKLSSKYVTYASTLSFLTAYQVVAVRTYAIIFNVTVKLPTKTWRRLIVFGLLVYNLNIYCIWQAKMIKELNIDTDYMNEINTLEQLLDSNLQINVHSTMKQFFPLPSNGSKLDTVYARLASRQVTNGTDEMFEVIQEISEHRNASIIISELYGPTTVAYYFDTKTGKDLLHVVPESPFEFYESMAVPKSSPYTKELNKIIMDCVEFGIIQHEARKSNLEAYLQYIRRNRMGLLDIGSHHKSFDFKSLKAGFYGYLIFNAAAIVVFVLELIAHKIFN